MVTKILLGPTFNIRNKSPLHLVNKAYANTMKLFRFSLNYKDEPPADMMIGILYMHGLGVELDYQKARESLLAGAGKGNIPCLYMLGIVYKEGLGVDKNEETAFLYFNKATHHGSLRAEKELGTCYYEGRGVAKNEADGLRWLHKANERDDPKAREYLAKIKAI